MCFFSDVHSALAFVAPLLDAGFESVEDEREVVEVLKADFV
jgi:hypothetical protein